MKKITLAFLLVATVAFAQSLQTTTTIQGVGLSGCQLSVPDPINMPDTVVGQTSNFNATLSNAAGASHSCEVTAISFNSAEFAHQAALPLVIAPGGSVPVAFTFIPAATGSRVATVTVDYQTVPIVAAAPWVDPFTPLREFYVAPGASGVGTPANPMSLATAISQAVTGDLYWLQAGTYTGEWTLSRAGTSANPIVWRAVAGARATVVGAIEVTGGHNWVWGLEIIDPAGDSLPGEALGAYAPGIHFINNYVHDICQRNGIGGWNTGADHVYYGNIGYRSGTCEIANHHVIYTQNDFEANGMKYVVGNIVADAANQPGSHFNFHAYTQSGRVEGYWIERNINTNGGFLLGGTNQYERNNTVKGNLFHNSSPQMGYARPTQFQLLDNYIDLSGGGGNFLYLWGVPEDTYTKPGPTIITGNTFIRPDGPIGISLRTSSYHATWPGQCEGCPAFDPLDIIDNNTYIRYGGSNVAFGYEENGNGNLTATSIAAWRSVTGYDLNSTISLNPAFANAVFVLPNEYEAGRGHIAIYNWESLPSEDVDISSIVANGADYEVYRYDELWGTPVASGTYSGGTVNLPVNAVGFMAFVVLSQ